MLCISKHRYSHAHCCCSVTKSCLTFCSALDCNTPGFSVLHYLPELAQTHARWVGDAIQPSHPLSSPSPPASIFLSIRSFLMSWLFTSDGQSIRTSASASVLPMNIQDWFPLGLTGLILQSKVLSRVFSNTTVQKHQFFGIQVLLWSNSHRCCDYWKNHSFDLVELCIVGVFSGTDI